MHWSVVHRSPTLEELQAPAGWSDPAADRGSGQQVADHGVGQQPALAGQHQPLGGELDEPPATRSATSPPAVLVEREHRQPVAQPDLEQHPLDPPGLVVERLARGGRAGAAASRPAYAAGCLTFHQRTPPTWLCAPGPTPHQWPPVQ